MKVNKMNLMKNNIKQICIISGIAFSVYSPISVSDSYGTKKNEYQNEHDIYDGIYLDVFSYKKAEEIAAKKFAALKLKFAEDAQKEAVEKDELEKKVKDKEIDAQALMNKEIMRKEKLEEELDSNFVKQIVLYVGDIETLSIGSIKRIAVGQGSVLSTSILENGQLLLLAEEAGETKLRVWMKNGEVDTYKITVQQNDLIRQSKEVRELVQSFPSVTQKRVGSRIYLEGNVDQVGKDAITIIQSIYPDSLVDLTRVAQISSQKMIHMKVQITEFNTSKLKALGINWQNTFNGPSLGYATETVFEDTGQISVIDSQPSGVDLKFDNSTGQVDVSNGQFGYFGIATQVLSNINLAKNNGDALILAEPSLSARSGGEALFLSGGEVPLPVTSSLGQSTVEFKEFGIKLRIKPLVDERGNIVAEVETELSTVDTSLAVNGIPGFRSRKVSTDVSLKDGQTLVVSGLINKDFQDNTTGLAFLSDLPVLGPLFRSEEFRNSKSELVIFVTPYIIDEGNAINQKAIQYAKDLREGFLDNVQRDANLLD
jgi:pilus assembly protein CpaC